MRAIRARGPLVVDAAVERANALIKGHLEAIDLSQCGFGREIGVATPHHDPMAWSLYGRGFLALWRRDGSAMWRNAAENAVRMLLHLRTNTQGQGIAWGLPYAWKEKPANHPYAITTAMCGDFLLEAKRAGLQFDHSIIDDCAIWLTRVLPWVGGKTAGCPTFAPDFPYLAVNVASRTSGFLLTASRSGYASKRARDKGMAALRYVLAKQAAKGYWFYGSGKGSSPKVDNIHTAYVLEGLLKVFPTLRHWQPLLRCKVQSALKSGLHFYDDVFFDGSPSIERAFIIPADQLDRWLRNRDRWPRQMLGGQWLIRDPSETRSWALGAALTTFSEACLAGFDSPPSLADVVSRIEALSSDGRFFYRTDDRTSYVRHEAHIFQGLCSLSTL